MTSSGNLMSLSNSSRITFANSYKCYSKKVFFNEAKICGSRSLLSVVSSLYSYLSPSISSRTMLLFVTFSATFFCLLCSIFAGHTRSFNLRWQQETVANLRRDAEQGSTRRFMGDIYYRCRGIIGRRSVPLCSPVETIFGTKLLASPCASSEKVGRSYSLRSARNMILVANKGSKIFVPITAIR